ncbi:TauD/TfdA family dioxygenase [Sandarakinorhabdus sp.]|uniref:TauD/TfdA dioxygenase family protein n=1 Tax=Sandarakinorhabdus sp. TaxID=1916663 RepID=UPI00333F9BCF
MIVRPLAPFGAEVIGLDWAGGCADHRQLAELVARHRVLVLRGQTGDDRAFTAFLRGFGPLVFTEGEVPVPGAPLLNIVTNVGRTTPPVSRFHTDSSYFASPPALTALRPVHVPESGGTTMFSDQVRAAAGLPQRWRQCLEGRRVLHRCTGLDGIDEQNWHPLFRRHPVTGETALYLSTPARCIAIEGIDSKLAGRILAILYRRSQPAACLYRHAWRPDDLLIWDNRVTMHRADHDGVSAPRTLHRGMVAGEAPLAAGGFSSGETVRI